MTATATTAPNIEPFVNRITITPNMAANWLDQANINNRRLRRSYAERLARDMAQGRWRLTHQGIAFDPHGVLLDGQHRLLGVVLADVPVDMHVWFNVTSETRSVIDVAPARSIADVLRISQVHGRVTAQHIAVLKTMLGGLAGPAEMTPTEASEALKKHWEAVAFAIESVSKAKYIGNATTRAVIARAFYSVNCQRLRMFGRMLTTGIVPDASATSIMLLRQNLYHTTGGSRVNRRDRYAKTQRALMAFLNGERITRLIAARQELFPLPEEVEA